MKKFQKIASRDAFLKHLEEVKPLLSPRMDSTGEHDRHQILVCSGTGCVSSNSKAVVTALQDAITSLKIENKCQVIITGCHGFCEQGPLVVVYPGAFFYTNVKKEDCLELVKSTIVEKTAVKRLLFHEGPDQSPCNTTVDIDFYKHQHRLVLKNCGHINPEDIDEYLANGGYQGLVKALFDMTPETALNEVIKSGLRGRGGGGFPTGTKWNFCRKVASDQKYIICNADEGDPGAFMDRSVLEGDPHAVLEGMAIGAYAIGATKGYIYARAEYPLAIQRLKIAITQARECGLLGKKILGSDFEFDIEIKEGAGAFVCGEETALMQSIEGKRGMPRPRPPFPAVSGLWGKPTVLNNVETFANVSRIICEGADEYKKLGTPTSTGTKVFALTGNINNTGLAEVPMGTTIRTIVFDIAGGIKNGKKFKAVQVGGPSGGCLPKSLLDCPVDYDTLITHGAMMGSGGLVVVDEDTCMVDLARFFLNFTQSESCGKCTPCREGTKRMLEILERICNGKGEEGDIEELEDLAAVIKSTALCGLGQTAPNPVLSTLRYFRHEYEAHIYDKKCPARVCVNLLDFYIDAEKCVGCGMCAKNCPAGAITGEKKSPHAIDRKKCIKCGSCMTACKKFKAIYKQ